MVPLTAVGGGDFDDGAQNAHGTPQRASEQAFALHQAGHSASSGGRATSCSSVLGRTTTGTRG